MTELAALASTTLVSPDGSDTPVTALNGGGLGFAGVDHLLLERHEHPAWLDGAYDIRIGRSRQVISAAGLQPPSTARRGIRSSVRMVICDGQSWARGTGGVDLLSTTARFGNLKFIGGVRPDDNSTDRAVIFGSMVPLTETLDPTLARGETPCSGLANALMERAIARAGTADIGTRYIAMSPGQSSAKIEQLRKGSSSFNLMMDGVAAAYTLCVAAGESFDVAAVTWQQEKGNYDGEGDGSPDDGEVDQAWYLSVFLQFVRDVRAGIADRVPGASLPRFYVFGTGSHVHAGRRPSIALALLQAAQEYPDLVTYVGPMSAFAAASDNVHYPALSNLAMGALAGIAADCIEAGEGWPPLTPIDSLVQGRVLEMRYPVDERLEWDPTMPNPANRGITLVDAAGAPLAISSVEIAGRDRVVLRAEAPIPVGARKRTAWVGTGAGRVVGARCPLRDSRAYVHDPAGLALTLHKYSALDEQEL